MTQQRQVVLTDNGAQVYQKGKLVAEGPIHKIREYLDDEDQLEYLRRWRRLKGLRKARCKRRKTEFKDRILSL